jgi:hypothetical protein
MALHSELDAGLRTAQGDTVGEPVSTRRAPRGQVLDPLAYLRYLLACSQGELGGSRRRSGHDRLRGSLQELRRCDGDGPQATATAGWRSGASAMLQATTWSRRMSSAARL